MRSAVVTSVQYSFTELSYATIRAIYGAWETLFPTYEGANAGLWSFLEHRNAEDSLGIFDPLELTAASGDPGVSADGSDDVPVATLGTFGQTNGYFALYQLGLCISNHRMLIAEQSQSRVGDIIGKAVQQVVRQLHKTIITDLHGTGSSGGSTDTAMIGIDRWLLTTGTIMGIDRGTYTQYVGHIVDKSAQAMTVANLASMYNTMTETREGNPTDILLSQAQFDKLAALSAAPQASRTMSIQQSDGPALRLLIGETSGYYKNLPLRIIRNFPTDLVAFVDKSLLYISHNRHVNFGPEVTKLHVDDNDNLRCNVSMGCQLRCDNPYRGLAALINVG